MVHTERSSGSQPHHHWPTHQHWVLLLHKLSTRKKYFSILSSSFYSLQDNFNHSTFECATGLNCDDYTQMMWASSTSVGVGIAQNCQSGQFLCTSYVVFRFTPAGNVAGQYPANVSPATTRFMGLMNPSDFLAALFANN